MQKCSRQIVQEETLGLEPHLISTVVRLLLGCGCRCGTDRNNRSEEREKTKTPEDFSLTILPQAVNEQSNKYISGLLSPGTTASVVSTTVAHKGHYIKKVKRILNTAPYTNKKGGCK